MTNSVKFEKISDQISLKDKLAVVTIVLTKIIPVLLFSLEGTYVSDILGTTLTFTLTKHSVSIKGGCNTQKSDYQAYSNGNINFGPSFFSTRMGCVQKE